MLELITINILCVFGMVKWFRKKRVSKLDEEKKLPVWKRKNGKEEIEKWLIEFLGKLDKQ